MAKVVEKITIEGRDYSRFIAWPKLVRDGTVRCIACGQLDEPEWHDDALCLAARTSTSTERDS